MLLLDAKQEGTPKTMKLIISLTNLSKWHTEISNDYFENQEEVSLNLGLIEVSKIQQPYLVLPDESEVTSVKESILKNGFTHPILVFKIKETLSSIYCRFIYIHFL